MHRIPHKALVDMLQSTQTAPVEGKELVFQHVPYNFGHTVEEVSAFGHGLQAKLKFYDFVLTSRTLDAVMHGNANEQEALEKKLNNSKMDGAEIWGSLNPRLVGMSEIGCPMYLTPPSKWPESLAKEYFGQKQIFGLLRDPYERLVAMFRGSAGGQTGGGYGGDYSEFGATCDVDSAVRLMMTKYKKDPTSDGCVLIPQAEYFKGNFAIQTPLDNRLFPDSVNRLFDAYGYGDRLHIETSDILHVTGCPEVWAGSLSPFTRQLVKEVYAEDFKLLCKYFGYCDDEENTCIHGVPGMCPSNMTSN